MLKPICVKCQRFYRVKKNGYTFIEGMPIEGRPAPGTLEPEGWQPYKIWSGDLWECKGCGHQLVSGVGQQPIAIQHEPDFAEKVKKHDAAKLQVNDC